MPKVVNPFVSKALRLNYFPLSPAPFELNQFLGSPGVFLPQQFDITGDMWESGRGSYNSDNDNKYNNNDNNNNNSSNKKYSDDNDGCGDRHYE